VIHAVNFTFVVVIVIIQVCLIGYGSYLMHVLYLCIIDLFTLSGMYVMVVGGYAARPGKLPMIKVLYTFLSF